MIIEKTSWNLEDVQGYTREEFVSEQMSGPVYKEYSAEGREQLFNMVYDFSLKRVSEE